MPNLKKRFTCYLCNSSHNNRHLGGYIGSKGSRPCEEICERCIHINYIFITSNDMNHIDEEVIKDRQKELLRNPPEFHRWRYTGKKNHE